MIRTNELTFRYPGTDERALESVSFDVDDGDVLGVVGPVGAGKTSLCMALAGFVPSVTGGRCEGDLEVAGRDPRADSGDGVVGEVGMVFQDYSAQLTQIRVLDEVMAPLLNAGVPREEAAERARDLLDTVRLADETDAKTWELSGGQQQRVAIAATLATDPDVLLFDSATGMLDPEGTAHVRDLVADLAGEKTLVVAEDDPDALPEAVDRLLVLDDGEVVTCGPPAEVLSDEAVLATPGVEPPPSLRAARALELPEAPLTPDAFERALAEREVRAVENERPRAAVDGGAPESFGAPLVKVDDVRYEYTDGSAALDGVDLSVREGEVHAVIGGNGAGKTTLSKLLVGLLDPTRGAVAVEGVDTREETARDLAERVGVALQNPDEQLSERTVEAELRFPLERRQYERTGLLSLSKERRFDDDFVDERVAAARDVAGLDPDTLDRDPALLARGRRRLVTVAQALSLDPSVLVLDEPTVGLDPEGRRQVARTARRLSQRGKGVVVVEHDMDFVAEVADTVTVLADGEVVLQGPPREVFAAENRDLLADLHVRPPQAAQLARRVDVDAMTVDGLVSALAADTEVVR